MKRIEIKKPKGIKQFLRDTAAISPAIATLILIVIAAVAAAGVGILTQKAQDSANSQTANKNLDVVGTVKIKGGTNSLALTQSLVPTFQKNYPAVKIDAAGGGLFRGFTALLDDKVDIAGEWGPWSKWDGDTNWPQTVDGVRIPTRSEAVIQEGGANAKYWETPIGHDVVGIVSNIQLEGKQITLNVVPAGSNNASNYSAWATALAANNKGDYVFNIAFSELQGWYKNPDSAGIYNGSTLKLKITPVQYEYYSYAEQEFAKFLRLNDKEFSSGLWQLSSNAKALKTDKAIRDYISTTQGAVGFLPLGFATGGLASEGKANVISSYIANNKISPTYTNALDHRHDVNAYTTQAGFGLYNGTSVQNAYSETTGYPSACIGAILARGEDDTKSDEDNLHACLNEKIFYYTKGQPTGATKAFIEYATSPAGQKDIGAAGFVPLLS